MKKTDKHPIQIILVLMALVTLGACSKNKLETLKYIPQDANIVLSINASAIQQKLNGHQAEIDSLFMTEDPGSPTATEISKQLAPAIDWEQPVFLFIQQKNSMVEGQSSTTGLTVSVKSESKLADFVQHLPSKPSIEKEKNYSITQIGDKLLGWNKKVAILLSSGQKENSESLKRQMNQLFSLKEEESMADNKNLLKAVAEKGDINYYLNAAQALSAFPALTMTKAGDLIKNSYSYGNIDFNAGAIDIKGFTYPSKDLLDSIKKYPTETLDKSALENYPGKPEGMIDLSLNMDQIVSFITYTGVDQIIQPFLDKQGLTLNDIASIFKGEVVIAFSRFHSSANTGNMGNGTLENAADHLPKMDYLICAPIASKEAYDKIVRILTNVGLYVPQYGQLVPLPIAQNPTIGTYFANDKNLLIASSQSIIDSFSNGKSTIEWPDMIAKNIKGKTALFYLNIQGLLGGIQTGDHQSAYNDLAGNTFKDITGWGEQMKDDYAPGYCTIRFQQGNVNSLLSLLKYANAVKKIRIAQKKNQGALPDIDDDMDTNIPPPPGTDTGIK